MSIEEAASKRKVKPAFKEELEFENVSGCLKYFFMFLIKFILWTGLLPLKEGGSTELYEFKLLSRSTLFAFVRLLIVTFPFLILPLIFMFGGFAKQEYEEITGEKFYMKTPHPGLQELYSAEFYINFVIYILPFAFCFAGGEHFTKSYHLQMEFQDMMTMEDKPSFLNVKQVLFPIIGFLLFALGKLLNLIQMWTKVDYVYAGLYINKYTNMCYFVLGHLFLHFLLAIWENFLYQTLNMFQVMCSWTLDAKNQSGLLARANILPGFMEAIQGGFGFFILVDITLLLIYWLLHLYHAYFTFQVGIPIKEISL